MVERIPSSMDIDDVPEPYELVLPPEPQPGDDPTDYIVSLKRLLMQLTAYWAYRDNTINFVEWSNSRLGIATDTPVEPVGLYDRFYAQANHITRLQATFKKHDLLEGNSDESLALEQQFARIMQIAYFAFQVVEGQRMVIKTQSEKTMPYIPPETALLRFGHMECTEYRPRKRLLFFFLHKLYCLGYRRYRGACYKQIIVKVTLDDGTVLHHETHAWEKACDLDEFIHSVIRIGVTDQAFDDLIESHGNKNFCIDWLKCMNDPHFPELHPDRHVFAFPNGIYDAKNLRYYKYGEPIPNNLVACNYIDQPFPEQYLSVTERWFEDIPTPCFQRIIDDQQMGSDELPADSSPDNPGFVEVRDATLRVLGTHFPEAGVSESDAELLPTTTLGSLGVDVVALVTRIGEQLSAGLELPLEAYQYDTTLGYMGKLFAAFRNGLTVPDGLGQIPHTIQYTERQQVARLLYVSIGRLIYNVGEYDNLQYAMFIKGLAATGKSTMLDAIRLLYDPSDVAAISSDSHDKKFGLSAVVDKFLFVVSEAKRNFGLGQGDLQSMITGELIALNIKYKTGETRRWVTPGIFLGNEVPRWIDAQSSMSRRLLIWEYTKFITNKDTTLPLKLKAEIARLILKCNLAYRLLVLRNPGKDIWQIVPNYFRRTQENLKCQINPLVAFLRDESVLEAQDTDNGEKRFILFEAFQARYIEWCRNKNIKGVQFDKDHYQSVFDEHQLTVACDRRYWCGKMMMSYWVTGIGFRPSREGEPRMDSLIDPALGEVLNAVDAMSMGSD